MENKYKICNLRKPEQLIIWAIRTWVNRVLNHKDPSITLINVYKNFLIQESIVNLNKLMKILCLSNIKKLHVNNIYDVNVSSDEFIILSTFYYSQLNLTHIKMEMIEKLILKNSINEASRNIKKIQHIFNYSNLIFSFYEIYSSQLKKKTHDFNNVIVLKT